MGVCDGAAVGGEVDIQQIAGSALHDERNASSTPAAAGRGGWRAFLEGRRRWHGGRRRPRTDAGPSPGVRRPAPLAPSPVLAGALALAAVLRGVRRARLPAGSASERRSRGADDAALDVAESTPVEDRTRAPATRASTPLHYDLDLTWHPARASWRRRWCSARPGTPSGSSSTSAPPRGLRRTARRRGGGVRPCRQEPRRPGAGDRDRRYTLVVEYAGTPKPVAAPTTRTDFSTLGWTITRDDDLDDAGAVRRLLLVRRQRPAVRQGALRLHDHRARADARGRQRDAGSRRPRTARP